MTPNFERAECPVLTCTRTMPSSEEICSHCWQRVPATIRQQINKAKVSSRHRSELVALAVSAAQVAA